MLRVVYTDKHNGEQQEILVDQRGYSPINPMVAMEGFNAHTSNGTIDFVHIADVEGFLISESTPDTWEHLTIAKSGEDVVFIEVLPDPMDIIRTLVKELNKASVDNTGDVNKHWLGSLGLSHNEVLSYYGVDTLNIVKDGE